MYKMLHNYVDCVNEHKLILQKKKQNLIASKCDKVKYRNLLAKYVI